MSVETEAYQLINERTYSRIVGLSVALEEGHFVVRGRTPNRNTCQTAVQAARQVLDAFPKWCNVPVEMLIEVTRPSPHSVSRR